MFTRNNTTNNNTLINFYKKNIFGNFHNIWNIIYIGNLIAKNILKNYLNNNNNNNYYNNNKSNLIARIRQIIKIYKYNNKPKNIFAKSINKYKNKRKLPPIFK